MNDWKRSFLGKLETAKKQWKHKFEAVAADQIEPLFREFNEFTSAHGFTATAPDCEPGTRLFKFGLTENGYVLITYRMRSLELVEVTSEVVVPGPEFVEPLCELANLCDIDGAWVREQFEHALERFVVAFGAASAAEANGVTEPIAA